MMGMMMLVTIVLGVYPQPALDMVTPGLQVTLAALTGGNG